MTRRKHFTRNFYLNNSISLDELMNLSNDDCVKVSRAYFYFLQFKSQHVKNLEQKVFHIFYKYMEIDKMMDIVYGDRVRAYYLMGAEDIKFLIIALNDKPNSITHFLRTNIKVDEMEEKYLELKENYLQKKLENKQKNYTKKN